MREHVYLSSVSQNYKRSALGQLTLGYNGNCYEQVDGAVMGSPISAVVANLIHEIIWGSSFKLSSSHNCVMKEICRLNLSHSLSKE